MGLPGAIQEETIGSIPTLHPPIVLEPVVAVQRMPTWFHGQEHSWITLPAVQMAGGAILVCTLRKVPFPEEAVFKSRLWPFSPGLLARCACFYMVTWQAIWKYPCMRPNGPSDHSHYLLYCLSKSTFRISRLVVT